MKEKVIYYHSQSYIDLLAESGGILTIAKSVFTPIAGLFTLISFELGIMSIFFKAKVAVNKRAKDDKAEAKFGRVKLTDMQFAKLFLN